MSLARLVLCVLIMLALAAPAAAIFVRVPAERVDEVPVERLLANLRRNSQKLPPESLWRAIGRIHLLAYIHRSSKLPVYRDRPDTIAEGEVGDCAEMDKKSISMEDDGVRKAHFPKRKPGQLCEARPYAEERYLTERVVPPKGHAQDRVPSAHLRAAIDAYGRARKLDPNDLRTRIALAFVLDRAWRIDEAIVELRVAVGEGMRRTAPLPGYRLETMDWDLYVVYLEAADHLALIARDGTDRQIARTLQHRLKSSEPLRRVTPILIPLKPRSNFSDLIDPTSKVSFDFTGQGPAQRFGWLSKDAAWLVWDPKRKGKIESGFQLFGSVTWMMFWDNGYHALGSLDDNGDGRIAGKELEGLALWHDKNANGVSDKGEVRAVTDHDIVALSYAYHRASKNLWISKAGVTFRDGEIRPTYDWLLRSRDLLAASETCNGGEKPCSRLR
jgi:hypothetical protein